MRIVVTGAGGVVGRIISRRLARAGHDVTAIYRKSRPQELLLEPRVNLLQLDLRDIKQLPAIDGLEHCAADVPASCPDEEELFRSNVDATRALFAAARAAGVKRIIYCSS